MNVYKVPLTPTPQSFEVVLGTTTYNVVLRWNTFMDCWVIDFFDVSEDPILQGVPLITGADLLAQYGYMGFGGQLIAQTDNNIGAVPTFTNLGTDSNLYFVAD